jgi:hypothetical protein
MYPQVFGELRGRQNLWDRSRVGFVRSLFVVHGVHLRRTVQETLESGLLLIGLALNQLPQLHGTELRPAIPIRVRWKNIGTAKDARRQANPARARVFTLEAEERFPRGNRY